MSSPLVATHRVTLPYTVDGRLHKIRAYMKRDPGVVTPPYFIFDRTGASLSWNSAVEQLAFDMGYIVQQTIGPALFEELVGTIWNPLDVYQPTGQSAGGAPQHAWEWVVVLRDTAFKQLHVDFMEDTVGGGIHLVAYNGDGASLTNCLKEWTAAHVNAAAPYMWQVSRSNLFLATSPFISATHSMNRKLRRVRGLA